MARRLSSIFGIAKDDHTQHDLLRSTSTPHLRADSPPKDTGAEAQMPRLAKPSTVKGHTLLELTDPNVALQPPPLVTDMGVHPLNRDGRPDSRGSHGTRASSGSRPTTPTLLTTPAPASPVSSTSGGQKIKKRKSWIPGKHDHPTQNQTAEEMPPTQAWIAGLKEHIPYDLRPLLKGDRLDELWDPNGDVIVYLFPESAHRSPSFRVSSELFADSRTLNYLCQSTPAAELDGSGSTPSINLQPPALESQMANLNVRGHVRHVSSGPIRQSHSRNVSTSSNYKPTVPNFSTPQIVGPARRAKQEKAIYLPIELEQDYAIIGTHPKNDDIELLVLYRNFFAFLNGGALVATPRQNSLYSIFMGMSSILRRLQYGNERDSSWGAVPWSSFSRYTEELRLADVRHSREKNIEAILLGEAMRSWPLYNEGFVHAAGRLDDIKSIRSPKFARISPVTINRLERTNLELQQRLGAVKVKLDNFDFPSMFSGIANSQTATEAKLIRFKTWKLAFLDFRAFIIAQYKKRYGSWPPKAKSKKNSFEESGLNRLLLREVYQDFTDLYDLLADRTSITTRSADTTGSSLADDAESGSNETIHHAIRTVESEYDRSTPPVNPPIPFDVPLLPALANSFNRDHALAKHDPQNAKKLRDNEINALLLGSYNRESMKPTSMGQEFLAYERRLGTGKTLQELVDHRCGQWLFIYAVLQTLPMSVVDARDLKFTSGCEYFLCMAPRGGRPWMKEDTSSSRAWYNVASGGGLISLPADLIDHSVEGIYRRSHCWEIATKWVESLPQTPIISNQLPYTPLAPQPIHPASSPFLGAVVDDQRFPSPHASPLMRPQQETGLDVNVSRLPGARSSTRSSVQLALQEITVPSQAPPRPANNFNPNITFDNILGSNSTDKKGKKKK